MVQEDIKFRAHQILRNPIFEEPSSIKPQKTRKTDKVKTSLLNNDPKLKLVQPKMISPELKVKYEKLL